ncbi:hypothetical protein HYT58_01110, partial [Candidatus Woesearchaeota archaeon]|nr:hypothetical protein [Candidatus Woesearchaeota archaeon]
IDNYGSTKDASGGLYALNAQKRIVDIYYNELNDLVNGEEAYKNLIEKFGNDLTSGEIYEYQLKLDTLSNEKAGKSSSRILRDNNQNIKISLTDVRILSQDVGSRVKIFVTGADRIKEGGILRVGDRIDDLSGSKFEVGWIIDSIEDDKITIIPQMVQGNTEFRAVSIRLGGSANIRVNSISTVPNVVDERVTASINIEDILVKREAKITLIPESEKAFSESKIRINLPIEKRVLGPAIFSKSLDQEIGRAQDLIKRLDEIITSLEKIHKFWAQFCFATFTILWGKNLLFGGGRNAVVRQKLSESWKEKYADARASGYRKSYDSFIFEHKEEYETDFTNTGNIVDSIKSGAYQSNLPPEIRGLGKDYDEYKKDYYFLKESLRYEKDPAGQKTLFRQFATLTASTATTRIDNEFAAYEKAASWDELDEESKKKISNFIDGNAGFSNLKNELEGNEEEKYASLYRTHEAQILKSYREYRLNNEYDRYFGQGIFKKELESQVGADIVNKNLDEIDNIADTYRPGGNVGDLIEISVRDINNNELLFGGKRYVVDENKVTESLEKKVPVEITGLGKVKFVEEAKAPEYKHIPKIAVVEEGRARGKVSRISIDSTKYVEVEYSSSGNPVKYTVFERASPNGPLGRSSDYLKGTLDLEIIELSERAKYDKTAQEELNRLRGIQRCVALVNDKLGRGNYARGSQVVNCGNEGSYAVESIGPKEEPLTGASCTDFMSPGDCKLLFNACDPVVCPASRCNFGGRLEGGVKNVVESGIVGSLALCLPNAKEGIVMPVCLTGLLAGLQNIRSVLQGYEQCLKIAKVQGQSVGICDRLRSFYLCDILWREAITVLNLKGGIVGMLSEKVFDVGSGGGEYAYFKRNVENSVNSLGYFTQNYAKNVFASYSGGSLPEIGAEVCKALISKKLPGVGNFFAQVQRPESPPQFTAFFDEIPYSDITTPPQSQYSVFYHIYAGENEDISFSVYLRGSLANVMTLRPAFVAMNRKLQRGGFASENIDRVAQTGYNEICVEIRTRTYGLRTECGFSKVSTSFALSRLNELFISKEAGKQIKSEEECIPETTRLTSLEYDSGLSGGVKPGRVIVGANSPGLLETGLLRQCSKFDPDVGTGKDNWAPVGTCGKDSLGRDLGACWLYKPSVTENIKDTNIEGATLEKLPELAEKVAGEISDVDRPLSKQEVMEHVKTARRLSEVGDYEAAIEIYQNIVVRAIEDEDSAMAQFEIAVIYERWARKLKEEVEIATAKPDKEVGGVSGAEEKPTEPKQTEAQKKTETKLDIKITEFGQISNFNSIKESGIPFSYYDDTFLNNFFALQTNYVRSIGRKTSEKIIVFSGEDTIKSYLDRLGEAYGLEYAINEEGAIIFSEKNE